MRVVARLFVSLALAVVGAATAAGQTPRTTFGTVDSGVSLEVLAWDGSGRPVVLLAGGNQTAHSFERFAPSLAAFYRVYGITRRGATSASTSGQFPPGQPLLPPRRTGVAGAMDEGEQPREQPHTTIRAFLDTLPHR